MQMRFFHVSVFDAIALFTLCVGAAILFEISTCMFFGIPDFQYSMSRLLCGQSIRTREQNEPRRDLNRPEKS